MVYEVGEDVIILEAEGTVDVDIVGPEADRPWKVYSTRSYVSQGRKVERVSLERVTEVAEDY